MGDATGGDDAGSDRFQRRAAAAGQHDIGALMRQREGGRFPNAAAGAGDPSGFAF